VVAERSGAGPGAGGKRRGRRYRPWFFLLAVAFLLAGAGYAFYSGSLGGPFAAPDAARQGEQARLAGQYQALAREVAALRQEWRRWERERQAPPPAFQEINQYWALMEAEHLLVLASHRLAAGEAAAAIALLEIADTRLRGLGAPGLEQVRDSLEADLARIRAAVGRADARELSAYLAELGRRAERLPLRLEAASPESEKSEEPEEPETPASGERSFLATAWDDLRGLLTIRKVGDEPAALAFGPPSYARQMLKLEAEHARLAVLRRDDEDFQNSRRALMELLRTQFDPRQPPVQETLAALQVMRETRLRPDLPGPDSALENLRAYLREFAHD